MPEPIQANPAADAEAPVPDRQEMKNILSRNVSVGLFATVFYLITRVGLPPFILSRVSLEEYGIWAAAFVLISYVGMSIFGISNVYIRYIAEWHAKGELKKIDRLLSTGLTITLSLSFLFLAVLWFALPYCVHLFQVSPKFQEIAFILFFTTAATFMLDLSLGAFGCVLHGLQKGALQTVVYLVSITLEAVLIVVLLLRGFGLYALVLAFAARYVFTTVGNVFLCYRALPALSVRLPYLDRESLRYFYRYGVVVQISGILNIFLFSIEKLIAGIFLGVSATGLMDVGEKLPVMASQIPSSLNVSFLPAMSHLHGREGHGEIVKLFLKGSRYLSMLLGIILGFLFAFAGPLMVAWVGKDDRLTVTASILAIFTLPYHFHQLTGPGSAYHKGVGRPVREFFYPVSQALLIVLTVSAGFLWKGQTVLVIAAAVGVAMGLSALLYMAYTSRIVGVPLPSFLWSVILPGLAPYPIGFVLAKITQPWFETLGGNRWEVLALLALAGTIYVMVCGGFLFRFGCEWGEREYLRKQALHTWKSLFRRPSI